MKNIAIVGVGLGADTVTGEALNAIKRADVLLGAQKLLDGYGRLGKVRHGVYLPQDVASRVAAETAENFAVLVSGDVGFYSAATGLKDALCAYSVRFVPGVSTVSAFFARLKLPWEDAALVSAHGRALDIAGIVRRNRMTFCLAESNANRLGDALCKAGFSEIKVHVGENLGMESERVYQTSARELSGMGLPSLTVLLFVNEEFDERIPIGLPDRMFSRLEGIPMTKSETRAVVMSKLSLRPASTCYDIGAGTGSVTVEMALAAYRGRAYAIERADDAIPLIEKNCALFHLGNVVAVHGEAPEALADLPVPDAVFIGGSGGNLAEIVTVILGKNRKARIVVTAVTLETVSQAVSAFENAGLTSEIIQINVARSKEIGGLHMMEAQNPITILSAVAVP